MRKLLAILVVLGVLALAGSALADTVMVSSSSGVMSGQLGPGCTYAYNQSGANVTAINLCFYKSYTASTYSEGGTQAFGWGVFAVQGGNANAFFFKW
jgi:hypothetical protein